MSLGAVVICCNEERNIGRCLGGLGFCEEIIVVDSGSTDRTLEIAYQYTEKVFIRPWKGYAAQKNEAISLCSCDWILSVDADEEVTEKLRDDIRETMESQKCFSAFRIPRKTIQFGRWIRHGGWYPNHLIRLFRKSEGRWVGSELHERWETAGSIGTLKEDLIHYSFFSLSDQVQRNNIYSTLGAQEIEKKGIPFSLWGMISKPLWKFIETYILKRGFLDGYPGLIISISAAYSVFLKWAKLWEFGALTSLRIKADIVDN